MSYEEFKNKVNDAIIDKPKYYRLGQFIFNYIDEVYGVAREVQFIDGIDCFHNDENIEEFLLCAYKRINFN